MRDVLALSGNCAQTSFAVLQQEFGLEGGTILKALTPFPGIALRGETCGTVVGCLMAIGFVYGRDKLDDWKGYIASLPPGGSVGDLKRHTPGVGQFMYGLNSNLLRRMSLTTAWIYDARHITDDYFDNVTRFHKVKGTTEVLLRILRKQFFHALPHEVRALGQMGLPVLLVWGRHDKAIPFQRGEEMHRLLKGSRMEVFEQTGHCPHDERSERFNQLALGFLSSTGAAA